MKYLFKYVKKYWFLALLGPLLMGMEVVMDLIVPKLSSALINEGVLNGDMELIFTVGLKMLGICLIGGAFGITSGVIGTTVSQRVANDMRKDVFSTIMRFSYSKTDYFTVGSLTTRISNDVSVIQQLVQMSLRLFMRIVFLFFGGISMMLSLNVDFGIVLMIALPLIVVIAIIFFVKSAPYFSLIQLKLDKINTVVQENVTGARVVKAFNNEDYEIDRFNDANIDLSSTLWKVNKMFAFMNPIVNLIFYAVIISVYVIGANLVNNIGLLAGDIFAAVAYINMILVAVMLFAMFSQFISRGRASLKRISEILDTDIEYHNDGHQFASFNSLEFKHVYFGYNETDVLRDINFRINRGDTIGIIGGTGSGKTSLLNLIPRFYEIRHGEILLNDLNIYDYDLKQLRSKIAFVAQNSELYSTSILENIRYGKSDATLDEVKKACDIAQASSFIEGFEKQYDTLVLERGASLSGGQKQRLSLARALVKQSDILILDDATSALDLKTEANFYKALKEEQNDLTRIIVAQRISSIKNATSIIVLDDGEIKGIGTHEYLLSNCEIYRNIYESQLKQGGVLDE